MGNPVVHFEVSGEDPEKLREYYRALFGWEFDTTSPVAPSVSEAGNYGFMTSTPQGSCRITPIWMSATAARARSN
jgi:predicted enzyme related to lactoylglutathione lyase